MEPLAIVKEISKTVDSLLQYVKENRVRQSETQLIRDKKRLKSATNLAQKIFSITDKYAPSFEQDERSYYEKLRKKFDEKD